MLDEKALILIAHSDRRTLMSLYTLLDAEGYFVAPCFSNDDLLKYCKQYRPELVMTSNPLCGDEGGRLLETIEELSPKTRVIVLSDVLTPASSSHLNPGREKEVLRIASSLPDPWPPLHVDGF